MCYLGCGVIVTGPAKRVEVAGEVPSGAVDGVNAVFFTAYSMRPLSEVVYLNGVRQKRLDDYTVTAPTSFTFVSPPHSGDVLLVDYTR